MRLFHLFLTKIKSRIYSSTIATDLDFRLRKKESIKCTSKSKSINEVRQIPWCKFYIEINVHLSVLFQSNEQPPYS